MSTKTKTKVSIITFIGSIIIACIAFLLLMLPISGFFIYPCVCIFAVLLNIVSWIFAKGNRILRVLNFIIAILLTVSIVADVIFLIRFMTGFQI